MKTPEQMAREYNRQQEKDLKEDRFISLLVRALFVFAIGCLIYSFTIN